MSTPFLAEIKLFTFNFAPKGWAQCNGQLLPINQNQALFSILGTTYGGNGTTTFALPNLQGRIPCHFGNGFTLGQSAGEEAHTLLTAEMPSHTHLPMASSAAGPDQGPPTNNLWSAQASDLYAAAANNLMSPAAIAQAGGNQPHENRPPYLVLNLCIACRAFFPAKTDRNLSKRKELDMNPFVGEIRIFGGNFAPTGWALCDGQLMPISQNTALFSLLGTQFGGDGKSNFALPNLQGSIPMDFGNGPGLMARVIGETGGESSVTLIQSQIPAHRHGAACTVVTGDSPSPVGNIWAEEKKSKGALPLYSDVSANPVAMSPVALNVAGGGQPHNNLAPYLVLTFIIALQGVFPARS